MTSSVNPESKWVALTEVQVESLPDRTPVRVESEDVAAEGPLHRKQTRWGDIYLHRGKGWWFIGAIPHVTVYVRPQDVPVDPYEKLVEQAAKSMTAVYGEKAGEDYRRTFGVHARTELDVFWEAQKVSDWKPEPGSIWIDAVGDLWLEENGTLSNPGEWIDTEPDVVLKNAGQLRRLGLTGEAVEYGKGD